MKIAVPFEQGEVFQHFGHTEEFLLYTVEDGAVTGKETLFAAGVGHEDLAGLLKEKGVATVLCGGIGGGAEQALRDAGLTLCSGVTGSADEAVSAYLAGALDYGTGANCDHHHDHDHGHGEGGCGGGCGGCGDGCGGGCGGCGGGEDDGYIETRTFPEIVTLTYGNFEQEVLQDPGLLCIKFSATWCGPCKMMAPIFEAVHEKEQKVKFCMVDVDEQPEIAQLFGIESVPTVVLVRRRRTLTGFVGLQDEETLYTMVEAYVK